MTTFGTIVPDFDEPEEEPTVLFIESADPVDLETRVNAALAAMDPEASVVTNITLAGAGDGHTFVVLIESISPVGTPNGLVAGSFGGVASSLVRCYLGGSDEELAKARLRAGVPPPIVTGDPPLTVPYVLVDEQVAGGAKGQRFMGLEIYTVVSIPQGIFLRPRVLGVGTTNQALGAGQTILTFASIENEAKFSLLSPQEINYTGNQAFIVLVEASVSVTQNGAGDFTVAIVKDPTGTPEVVASMTSHTGAGETDTVAVFGYSDIFPPLIQDTKFGLIVTSTAGVSAGAQLRITAELAP
jgi:hypothetical protein